MVARPASREDDPPLPTPIVDSPHTDSNELDTEFKRKYPPDRILGDEAAPHARVWNVYRGEAIDHDDALLKNWNDTINILLTFAGLFSAAVTTFVAQSSQSLQQSPNVDVVAALYMLIPESAGVAPRAPPSPDPPANSDRWINGLWFISLFLSLAAALVCILVKQWLDEYTSRTRDSSKDAREWALRRAFYFGGLDKWHIASIISILPLILHLALFLFLAGVVVFLWKIEPITGRTILGLLCLLAGFYLFSLFVPFFSADCPFSTPLVNQLRRLSNIVLITFIHAAILVVAPFSSTTANPPISATPHTLPFNAAHDSVHSSAPGAERMSLRKRLDRSLLRQSEKPFDRVLADDKTRNSMARAAIDWLLVDVSDSDTGAVALQALPALHREYPSSVDHLLTASSRSSLSVLTAGQLNMVESVRVSQYARTRNPNDPLPESVKQMLSSISAEAIAVVLNRKPQQALHTDTLENTRTIRLAVIFLLENGAELNPPDILLLLSLGPERTRDLDHRHWQLVLTHLGGCPFRNAADWHRGFACESTCVLAWVSSYRHSYELHMTEEVKSLLIKHIIRSNLPLSPSQQSMFSSYWMSHDFPWNFSEDLLPFMGELLPPLIRGADWDEFIMHFPWAMVDILKRALPIFIKGPGSGSFLPDITLAAALLHDPAHTHEPILPEVMPRLNRANAQTKVAVSIFFGTDNPYWPAFVGQVGNGPDSDSLSLLVLLDAMATAICATLGKEYSDYSSALLEPVDFDCFFAHAFRLSLGYNVTSLEESGATAILGVNEIVPLVVRIWRHCLAIDPSVWSTYFETDRPALDLPEHIWPQKGSSTKPSRIVNTVPYEKPSDLYFAVKEQLKALGPCTEGRCGHNTPKNWPCPSLARPSTPS